jgi:hypothetical protein
MKKNFLIHVFLSLIVGALSLYLAFGWPGYTECWAWNFGWIRNTRENSHWLYIGGYLEFARLIIGLVLLTIIHLLFKDHAAKYWDGSIHVFRFHSYAFAYASTSRRLFLISVPVAVFIFILFAPSSAQDTFANYLGKHNSPPYYDCLKPYIFYLPYALFMYYFVLVPILLPVYDSIKDDRNTVRKAGEPIDQVLNCSPESTEALSQLSETLVASRGNVRRLFISITNKYVWLTFSVVIYFLIENMSVLILTLSCNAQDFLKIGIWTLISVVIYFIVVSLKKYNHSYNVGLISLNNIGDIAREKGLSRETFLRNSEIFERNSLINFIKLLLKSTTISLFLVGMAITIGVGYARKQGVSFASLRVATYMAFPSIVAKPLLKSIDVLFPPETPLGYDIGCRHSHTKGEWKGLMKRAAEADEGKDVVTSACHPWNKEAG